MRYTNCIFETSKKCDDCKECDLCDLDNKKICNSCGKCLEMEGIDTKAIKISDVIKGEEESKLITDIKDDGLEKDLLEDEYEDTYEETEILDDEYTLGDDYIEDKSTYEDVKIEFIDDIDGLREIINEGEKLSEIATEKYPGLYVIKDHNKNK